MQVSLYLQEQLILIFHHYQEWALELEEVFSLEREGEMDKYAPHRAKLKNKMLLWHGELRYLSMMRILKKIILLVL